MLDKQTQLYPQASLPVLFHILFIISYVYIMSVVCVCMQAYMCHSSHMDVREQL